jgi:CheY-like chemotaxis protein
MALNSAKVTQALLAGRKLLLADDSITIQKVVDLTFADEGVSVLCVNNGREAIERLEDFAPDVVLADIFMPQMNGYEVCEYIKQNQNLKQIPVILLVGSFEPFDETEARRVGADDTLTKPFQSIRRLIDKVGSLVGGQPPEELISTAELPKPEVMPEPEPEKLSEQEIEMTTADTQPLPSELSHLAQPAKREVAETSAEVSENYESAGDVLLDLGDYRATSSSAADDFVLDIDLDEVPEESPVEASFSAGAFRGRESYKPATTDWKIDGGGFGKPTPTASTVVEAQASVTDAPVVMADQMATTQEFMRPGLDQAPAPAFSTPQSSAEVSSQSLSPEMIDAIARRAVELLSEKVVQEIAWEVVPPLAELMIKRQLEEKNS